MTADFESIRRISITADEAPEVYDTGQADLEDRHSLRRVAGLSTELQDVSEVEYRALRLERVVLLGVWTEGTQADGRELTARAGRPGRDRRVGGA